MIPDAAERADDELRLAWLSLWDQGFTARAIADCFEVSRNAVVTFVWRIHQSDPEALARKPQRMDGAHWGLGR